MGILQMNQDNPAARLLALLKEGRTIAGQTPCQTAWMTLLKTDELPLLMGRLGKLYDIPNQVRRDVQEHYPSHMGSTSHWFSQVNNGFTRQNLLGDWNSFLTHIDDHTISYLSLTAELLQQKANTKLIADSELQAARARIDDLYNEVLSGDIPEEIKIYLARYLRRMLDSIDEYFLTGAIPLLEASNTLLGHAFPDENYRSFLRDTELGNKVMECMTAMANITTVATGLPLLAQGFKMLAGG